MNMSITCWLLNKMVLIFPLTRKTHIQWRSNGNCFKLMHLVWFMRWSYIKWYSGSGLVLAGPHAQCSSLVLAASHGQVLRLVLAGPIAKVLGSFWVDPGYMAGSVWKWISNFIPHFIIDAITYLYRDLPITMWVKGVPVVLRSHWGYF